MYVTRRGIRRALAVLWLLDGALQLQPFMFGRGFSQEILAPAGTGQPGWVSGPVAFFADVIGTHPAALNTVFTAGQIAIGLGLLVERTTRLALGASIAWSLGVWWFGEGLGGLAGGHASLVTGAPGAVALYGVLAAAAWPGSDRQARPAAWLPTAWAVVWLGGALLQTLPGQNRSRELAATIAGNADGAPIWLAAPDRAAAHAVTNGGTPAIIGLTLAMALVGILALRPGAHRAAAATAGGALALVFWVVGQNVGDLFTGQATDPNTGPLILLMALSIAGQTAPRPRPSAHQDITARHQRLSREPSRFSLAHHGGTT